jgi:hypothetical protein
LGLRLRTYQIHLTNPKHIDQVFNDSDRTATVIANLKRLYDHGRLGKTGYLSILPVDQGIEHTAAYSFYNNPIYFDPENIIKLAVEGGCNGVASTLGVLSLTATKYTQQIPYIVKLNHNELLTFPNKHDQRMFAQVEQAIIWVPLVLEPLFIMGRLSLLVKLKRCLGHLLKLTSWAYFAFCGVIRAIVSGKSRETITNQQLM